jgi:hypothetical protein
MRLIRTAARSAVAVPAAVCCVLALSPFACNKDDPLGGKRPIEEELQAAVSERPFSVDRVVGRLRKGPAWDRVLIFAPYRVDREFVAAGLSDRSLVTKLVEVSNDVEAWHVVVVDATNKILSKVHVSLEPNERPSQPITVMRRR